jgi:hypothetical protein
MTAYNKSTNFAAKDSLPESDPAKIIKGSEFNTEFDNLVIAVNSKANTASPTFTGTPTAPTATTGTNTTQLATTAFVANSITAIAAGVASFSGGTTGLTPNTATTGAVSLAGTLVVANGGTGRATLASNNVLLGNGTSSVQQIAPGTSGNVLTSNGTTWSSTALPDTSIGVGQTWQNFTTSTRVMGTTYTNSTGKPILVVVGFGRAQSSDVTVGGVTIATLRHDTNNNNPGYFSFIVPNGATYANTGSYSSDSGAQYWSELR